MANRIEKTETAYRSISEVAEIIGVETHVLRFWETKFSQIKPMKRDRGRRYYRAEDIRILHTIRDLLRVHGYTIKGARNLLRKFRVADIYQGADHILAASGAAAYGDALPPSHAGGAAVSKPQALSDQGSRSQLSSSRSFDLADLVSQCMSELKDARSLLTTT